MNHYQTAVDALKKCVTAAMNSDVDASTQGEIWRHYQGMMAIAKQLNKSNLSFKLDGIDRVMEMYDTDQGDGFVAAESISFGSGIDDIITFS